MNIFKTLFYFFTLLLLIPFSFQTNAAQFDEARDWGSVKQSKAFFRDDQLWEMNTGTGLFEIPVCWESYTQPGSNPDDRDRVKKVVEKAWEDRSFSLVDFTGWEECSSNDIQLHKKLIITVSNQKHPDPVLAPLASPYTMALGNHMAGRSGFLHLNFNIFTSLDSANLAAACTLSAVSPWGCIEVVAIHEFGHVLGMSHEQNRKDKPVSCEVDGDPQSYNGENFHGNSYFTDFDADSIMNYCNTSRFRDPLSITDKLAVQAFYGDIPSFSNNILTIPRLNVKHTPPYATYRGYYNAKLRYDVNTKKLIFISATDATNKPSTEDSTLSNENLYLPLLKVYDASGQHITQIIDSVNLVQLDAKTFKLEDTNQLIDNRVQPKTYTPGSKY